MTSPAHISLASRRWLRKNQRNVWLVLPTFAVLVLFVFRPLVVLMIESTSPPSGGWASNYRDLIAVSTLRASLQHTLILAIASTIGAVAIGTAAALALHDVTSRGLKRVATALVSFPLSLPGVIVGFLVIMIFGRAGALPKAIESLTGERRFAIAYSPLGLAIAYAYFQIPRVIGTLLAAIDSLDQEVRNTARTLGASARGERLTVAIPQLLPAMLSASGLSIATSIGAYGTVATLSQGYRVLPLDLADAVTNEFRRDRAGAIAVVLTVLATILFALCQCAATYVVNCRKGGLA